MGNSMKKVNHELREKYEKCGQGHVFEFLDKKMLSEKEEDALARQLHEIDVEHALELFKGSMAQPPVSAEESKITPVESGEVASIEAVQANRDEWEMKGLEAMSRGTVAFLVLSGGQGTRLGFDRAKGMYDMNLPSHKTLFQLQGERIRKLNELVKQKFPEAASKGTVRIPWYIMTSPLNDEDTRGFFKENKYFGLKKSDVIFFAQGTLPCITPDGKIILESKSKVSFAPDGNGGIYLSMLKTGVIKEMEENGIHHIHVTSVDNALVQVADPIFVGYCIEQNAQVGNKGCPKVSWDEKVGVMAKRGGKFSVVEYSELDEETAKLTSEDGKLLLSTGNICNHYFTLPFIRDVAIPSLTQCYHIANKKIPFADPTTGETTKAKSNNGIKLEMFIFDVFPLATNMGIFECNREEEFAPVKNAPGDKIDSPDSAREMIYNLHRSWLADAKISVEGGEDLVCEITPLVSLRGEGLEDLAKSVSKFQCPLLVCRRGEVDSTGFAIEKVSLPDAPLFVSHFLNSENIHVYEIASKQ